MLTLLVLCGVGTGVIQLITKLTYHDDWVDLGQPVNAPSAVPTPTPSWEKPNDLTDPQPIMQIRYELESQVLEMAGVAKPVKSSCDKPDFDGSQETTFNCTVTYEGLDVVYQISAKPTTDTTFEWKETTQQIVVTRDAVLREVFDRFGPQHGYSDVRCDELQPVALVPVGNPLPQHCYAKPKDDKTLRVVIGISESGVSLTTESQ